MGTNEFAIETEIMRELGYTRHEWTALGYDQRVYETTGYLDRKWRHAMREFDEGEKRKQEAKQRQAKAKARRRRNPRVRRRGRK